jgi:hypothetical protein
MEKFKECLKSFKDHPATAGETYWQHLCFTLRVAGRFFFLGFVSVVHGLLPFMFCRTSSNHIREIAEIFRRRTQQD